VGSGWLWVVFRLWLDVKGRGASSLFDCFPRRAWSPYLDFWAWISHFSISVFLFHVSLFFTSPISFLWTLLSPSDFLHLFLPSNKNYMRLYCSSDFFSLFSYIFLSSPHDIHHISGRRVCAFCFLFLLFFLIRLGQTIPLHSPSSFPLQSRSQFLSTYNILTTFSFHTLIIIWFEFFINFWFLFSYLTSILLPTSNPIILTLLNPLTTNHTILRSRLWRNFISFIIKVLQRFLLSQWSVCYLLWLILLTLLSFWVSASLLIISYHSV